MVRCEWQILAAALAAFTIGPTSARAQAPLIAAGRELYEPNCASCHYDGAGNPSAPDLKGSAFWKQGPDAVIRLLLRGQGGVSVVNGRKLNGQMPPMDYLSNEEIAAITAFVRAEFGGKMETISPERVEKLRAEIPQKP